MPFSEFGLQAELNRAARDLGWVLATPIQAEAIPAILGGRDVCASAETGSGKTAAFGMPCLQLVHEYLGRHTIAPDDCKKGLESDALKFSGDSKVIVCGDIIETRELDKWVGVRGANGCGGGGKYFFQCRLLNDGLCRFGWSTGDCKLQVGLDNLSFGYGCTGKKSNGGKFVDYGTSFRNGDVVQCMVDFDNRAVSFKLNNLFLGVAYTLRENSDLILYPAICGKGFKCEVSLANATFPEAGYTPVVRAKYNASLETVSPTCLVLEPTRELAQQTREYLRLYAKYLECPRISVGETNKCHICVSTLHAASKIAANDIKIIVLDEADELLKIDNGTLLDGIFNRTRQNKKARVQSLLFSATLHSQVVIARAPELTNDAQWIDLKWRPAVPETVQVVMLNLNVASKYKFERLYPDPPIDGLGHLDPNSKRIKLLKPKALVHLLDTLNIENGLLFCRTNLDCENLNTYLSILNKKDGNGTMLGRYSAAVLAAKVDMHMRKKNLADFKAGTIRYLVCTDVAARGIDVEKLPFCAMLNVPQDKFQFLHRIGRVGRAGAKGIAVAIASTNNTTERIWWHTCASKGNKNRPLQCSNYHLVSQGGCTIKANETQYLQDIYQLLEKSEPFPEIEPNQMALPTSIYNDESADSLHNNPQHKTLALAHCVEALEGRLQTAFLLNCYN